MIGVFNSAKAALYNELVDLEDEFLNHDLVKIFISKENSELNQGELSMYEQREAIASVKII